MENSDLLLKIKMLEKELDSYKNKEEYTKIGLQRTKNVYEIARKNSEIIISKAINLAYEFKKEIELTLQKINKNPLEFSQYLQDFLKKHEYFIENKDPNISQYLDEIIAKFNKK
ncbi:hypothetical protein [Spiroplasma cantharicola]|uniref:Uncharacterized protein n=1 Tax=Spiroplasma cantharicola TaxID=362837 RepID=A0A0M4KF06_9MOLU|nr:hypothetical protein [Spiroplasma cantharicola]ALD66670.1 hypothetical protein SCANT_v1c07640 [Spiroplasma cantharicola]